MTSGYAIVAVLVVALGTILDRHLRTARFPHHV